nr:PREDICTED: interleukin-18 receptor 1-like [Latimeria chalumnae]|eukprot:XP_014346276.1 PREDICTED: interleukin-18 receptor 1-like [Latimeria chalumnae]
MRNAEDLTCCSEESAVWQMIRENSKKMIGKWLTLLFLSLFATYDTEQTFPSVARYAHEGEHVLLQCELQNMTPFPHNISWYKDTINRSTKLNSDTNNRVITEGYNLEFWPAEVNDTGNYSCVLFNGTQNFTSKSSLTVFKNDEGYCFNKDTVYPHKGNTGKSFTLLCPNIGVFNNRVNNVTWLKDCNIMSFENKPQIHFNSLKEDDSGNYSCILYLKHGGQQYYVMRTVELIQIARPINIPPKLIYPDGTQIIEVEIGNDIVINCTAFIGYTDDLPLDPYWLLNSKFPNNSRVIELQAITKKDEDKVYKKVELKIINITEEDLKTNYSCAILHHDRPIHGSHRKTKQTSTLFIMTAKDLITAQDTSSVSPYWRMKHPVKSP